MSFDPDAYLAAKQPKTFDPDAYLASKAPPAMTVGDRLRYAAHKTAGFLPMGGAIAGGFMGGAAGSALGPLGTIGGGAVGAGLLSAGGKSLQHAIDSGLGYEENPGIAAVTEDSLKTGAKDAALTGGFTMAAPVVASGAKAAAGAASKLLAVTPRVAEHLPYVGKGLRLLRMLDEARGKTVSAPSAPAESVPDPLEALRMPQSKASMTTSVYPEAAPPSEVPLPEAAPVRPAAAPSGPQQLAGESFGKGPSRLQRGATKAQLEYRAKLVQGSQPAPQPSATSDADRDAVLRLWRDLRSPSGKPTLLDLLDQIRKNRSETPDVP